MNTSKFPKLFIPGPSYVSDDVLEELAHPQIGHRTEEFSELFDTIVDGVQNLLYTKNHIYIVSHAATGLWEMGILNATKKGVLHAVNGAFSAKWVEVSKGYGFQYDVIDYEWGSGIKVEDVDKFLSSGNYDVFAMVHNETSTGVKSNLKDISKLMKKKYPDITWIVDAVSSMAGIKIETDVLGIDFIFASVQKAWGLPAGFSVCSISDKIIQKSKGIIHKGYFFNVDVYEKYYKKSQTPSTPSIAHMFGMKYILEKIKKEGLENRWKRHKDMAEFARKWALNHGQTLFPEKGCESETITCVNNDQSWDINKLNDYLLKKGFRMDRGYGPMRGKAFRLAHLGNLYLNDLIEYLSYFDEALNNV